MTLSAGELHEVLLRAAASVREDLFGREESAELQPPIDQTFRMKDGRFFQVFVLEADEAVYNREATKFT